MLPRFSAEKLLSTAISLIDAESFILESSLRSSNVNAFTLKSSRTSASRFLSLAAEKWKWPGEALRYILRFERGRKSKLKCVYLRRVHVKTSEIYPDNRQRKKKRGGKTLKRYCLVSFDKSRENAYRTKLLLL